MINYSALSTIVRNCIQNAVPEVHYSGITLGTYHSLLSKAFVAGLGKSLKEFYADPDVSFCYRDWNVMNQTCVSGEWMLDIAGVKKKGLPDNSAIPYIEQIVLAVESEFEPGRKAFVDDFAKLLVVNAPYKVYINGVKAKYAKLEYVRGRMDLIRSILPKEQRIEKYFICFVDHPSTWSNTSLDQIFIDIHEI